MKTKSTWENINFYRYFFSSSCNSGEVINLNLPNSINQVYTFAYLSELPYIENIIAVRLNKNNYTYSSFSFDCCIDYGVETSGNTYNKRYYANDRTGRYQEYVDYLDGIGFNFNIVSKLWSNRDKAYIKIMYRYFYNNEYTEWEQLHYFEFRDSHGNSTTDSKTIYKLLDIYPVDTVVPIEIKTILRADSYSSVDSYLTYNSIKYVKNTIKSGKIHWFAFAK